MTNRAITINAYGGPEQTVVSELAMPHARPGYVVVRVRAAAVNGLDWKIREGYLRDDMPLDLPATLGLELAGEVAEVPEQSAFAVGERVVGLIGGLGAYADYVAVPEALLVRTPQHITDAIAASLPVVALTAWQMLRAAGDPQTGQTILILGAAGGVGSMAVQLAKAEGLDVTVTSSATSRNHLVALGADHVLDRSADWDAGLQNRFDLIVDLVGGDAVDQAWGLLRVGGTLVSSVRPDVAAAAPQGKRGLWFSMQPDSAVLGTIAQAVAEGRLRSTIAEIVRFADLPAAIERNRTGHAPGKIVADFTLV